MCPDLIVCHIITSVEDAERAFKNMVTSIFFFSHNVLNPIAKTEIIIFTVSNYSSASAFKAKMLSFGNRVEAYMLLLNAAQITKLKR